MTYAGRLDPMADGILILLAGEEVYKKSIHLKKDKTYKVKIVLGIQTDSYDALGIPKFSGESPTDFKATLKSLEGEIEQSFPPYSAYKVHGKPLHGWAREGKLDEIEVPSKTRTIYNTEILNEESISSEKLLTKIVERISKVNGDFRQAEILSAWTKLLKETQELRTVTINVHCSSGTYMRSIAHELGGFALQITRTHIHDIPLQNDME